MTKDGEITNEYCDKLSSLRNKVVDGLFKTIITVEYIEMYSMHCYVEGNALLYEAFRNFFGPAEDNNRNNCNYNNMLCYNNKMPHSGQQHSSSSDDNNADINGIQTNAGNSNNNGNNNGEINNVDNNMSINMDSSSDDELLHNLSSLGNKDNVPQQKEPGDVTGSTRQRGNNRAAKENIPHHVKLRILHDDIRATYQLERAGHKIGFHNGSTLQQMVFTLWEVMIIHEETAITPNAFEPQRTRR